MAVVSANGSWPGLAVCFALAVAGCGSTNSNPNSSSTGGSATKSQGGAGASFGGASAVSGGVSGSLSGGSAGNAFGTGGAADGGAGGFTLQVGGAAPKDARPPAPQWQPPFALGTPGWKESATPLCQSRQGSVRAVDVWADSRGVFSLVGQACRLVGNDLPWCPPENAVLAGATLQFNDGTGWRPWLDTSASFLGGLTGFPSGPLLLTGFSDCGLAFIDGPASGACLIPRDDFANPVRAFAVDSDHAYAVLGPTVFEFHQDRFDEIAQLPEDTGALWADSELVVLAGGNQAVYTKHAGETSFTPLPNVPAGNYTAVWGFSANDLWFSNTAGQLVHYDGSKFQVLELGIEELNDWGASALWGSGDTLYWLSTTTFGRVRGGKSESLLTLPPFPEVNMTLSGLWGRSETEVFLTGSDFALDSFACGAQFLLWFDGAEFHRF